MTSAPIALEGVIRRYGWGSTTAIQRLLGVSPDGRPAAELWLGAHPANPSPVLDTTLDALIAREPVATLGAAVLDRFGPRLPFLLKVLAAERALSIQVHPGLAQARAGYAAEEAAGVARDAPGRNYTDANHKPELVCAVTPFEALCGFRPPGETRSLLERIGVAELDFLQPLLAGPDGLRAAFTALLHHDAPAVLADAVAARAEPDGALRGAHLAALDFPGDIGVVLALLMNYVRLAPGEAVFLGAGIVHAYLRGTGVEVMANSDNVLRCGLTAKHIDVAEVLRVIDFSELRQPRWPAHAGVFRVPPPDFSLREMHVTDGCDVPGESPRIVLCVAGAVEIGDVQLRPGHAAFLPAVAGSCPVRGRGHLFVASTG